MDRFKGRSHDVVSLRDTGNQGHVIGFNAVTGPIEKRTLEMDFLTRGSFRGSVESVFSLIYLFFTFY